MVLLSSCILLALVGAPEGDSPAELEAPKMEEPAAVETPPATSTEPVVEPVTPTEPATQTEAPPSGDANASTAPATSSTPPPSPTPPTPRPQPARPEDLPPSSRRGTLATAPTRRGHVRAATRPWFIHVAVGDDRSLRNIEYGILEIGSAHFEQAIGRHLDEGYGAALALVTQQTVAEEFLTYAFAGRFQYDIAVDPNLGVYLTPSLTIGYRRVTDKGTATFEFNCPDIPEITCEADVRNQATIQFGLGVTVIIADRLPLLIRPVGLDIGAPHIADGDEPAISLRWHIVGGLGVSF